MLPHASGSDSGLAAAPTPTQAAKVSLKQEAYSSWLAFLTACKHVEPKLRDDISRIEAARKLLDYENGEVRELLRDLGTLGVEPMVSAIPAGKVRERAAWKRFIEWLTAVDLAPSADAPVAHSSSFAPATPELSPRVAFSDVSTVLSSAAAGRHSAGASPNLQNGSGYSTPTNIGTPNRCSVGSSTPPYRGGGSTGWSVGSGGALQAVPVLPGSSPAKPANGMPAVAQTPQVVSLTPRGSGPDSLSASLTSSQENWPLDIP
eukprot:gnl/TRDRNA2_/TRDRNA2_85487_c0_seq2.p1 gnl/TRDRNA2_/TRDRNA2_85487_c0~~gnl/TRDRNA2_/TRDRNA2_85487_c0_seq2.p1  ORF type:complete len:276 (-),score=20.47 gnl/TRDRNA2_/TRDRNA2_85487_c0_seq2:7-789(-)